eukprot:gene23080-15667_t
MPDSAGHITRSDPVHNPLTNCTLPEWCRAESLDGRQCHPDAGRGLFGRNPIPQKDGDAWTCGRMRELNQHGGGTCGRMRELNQHGGGTCGRMRELNQHGGGTPRATLPEGRTVLGGRKGCHH